MGGDDRAHDAREAASALSWWLESGVDVAVQEQPRNWLAAPSAKIADAPAAESGPPAAGRPLPETLDLFRDWLAHSPDVPLASAGGRRVLPSGAQNPALMLMADMPSSEEQAAGQPIAGQAWRLMERMLESIGIAPAEAYSASISCFHAPGVRDAKQLEACGEIARHQVRLVKPKLLLLLGNEPARALLGKPVAAARGHVHKVEGVRTVATIHPRYLLDHPYEKVLAWRDLLLLTEEDM